MARAALGWSVRELAKKASVSPNTISRYENGADALGGTLNKIQQSFEAGGIAFIYENGDGVGVRLRKKK